MKRLFSLLCAAPIFAVAFIPRQTGSNASERYLEAIRSNDLSAVKQLIASGGIDVADELGNRPLMYASLDGSPECMDLLISAGADPNQANKDGATPLMWSVDSASKVGLLLKHGAKVDAVSKGKHSALELAANYDGSGQTVKMLLAKGANPNVEDAGGDTLDRGMRRKLDCGRKNAVGGWCGRQPFGQIEGVSASGGQREREPLRGISEAAPQTRRQS